MPRSLLESGEHPVFHSVLREGGERVGVEDSRGGETRVSLFGRKAVRWAQVMGGWPRASGNARC